ncbi:MAG: flavodoxin [Carboxylicivirga sp.]|jgi:flavodoxin I|nr:flavodoxin [Carboxylicivirga sp.]MCT4645730.1 flavodoxin [Carboxylicivirga sp.]
MRKTAILYGSSTGNTESVAQTIEEKLGNGVSKINVDGLSITDLNDYENLIIGVSTWGIGDLQDDWEGFLPDFVKADLNNKTIAFFGLGDCESYSDSFVDAMGIIYDKIKDSGCKVIGQIDTEDYSYDASVSEIDGKLIGLAIDEDNESDKTEERIDRWLEQIMSQL